MTVTIVGVTPPEFSSVDVGRAFDVAAPLDAGTFIGVALLFVVVAAAAAAIPAHHATRADPLVALRTQ